MDFCSMTALVAGLFILTALFNLPFGFLRKKARRFSFKWFLFIHVPIPFIFLARVLTHIDFRYVPLFVFAAVIGQLLGGRVDF